MSFIKRLLGFKSEMPPKDVTDVAAIVRCPVCQSEKVTLKFTGNDKTQASARVGRCVRIESGSTKKVCQECAHEWDGADFESNDGPFVYMK